MPEAVTNELILEHLKRLQAGQTHMRDQIGDLRSDMTTLKADMATLTGRIDRMDIRLERIERRLDLADAPAE